MCCSTRRSMWSCCRPPTPRSSLAPGSAHRCCRRQRLEAARRESSWRSAQRGERTGYCSYFRLMLNCHVQPRVLKISGDENKLTISCWVTSRVHSSLLCSKYSSCTLATRLFRNWKFSAASTSTGVALSPTAPTGTSKVAVAVAKLHHTRSGFGAGNHPRGIKLFRCKVGSCDQARSCLR